MKLELERLESRCTPSTAVFSNGVVTVLGDNQGNNISVSADANGQIHVSERGQEITINSISGAAATTANTKLVVERAGTGKNNTLSTDVSLGAIPDSLIGNGSGLVTFAPGNNAPSFATGSPNPNAVNDFISNPGGKDVFVGGAGRNVFDWEPGTGTDSYIGAGKFNVVQVVGNANALAENDSLFSDGFGGVTYSRNNLVPFQISTTGIQAWNIEPSAANGNTMTIGDLSGTDTEVVAVNFNNGTVDASAQADRDVALVVNGVGNNVSEGAGRTFYPNITPLLNADIVALLQSKKKRLWDDGYILA